MRVALGGVVRVAPRSASLAPRSQVADPEGVVRVAQKRLNDLNVERPNVKARARGEMLRTAGQGALTALPSEASASLRGGMSRPCQVRAETDLCRAPLWSTGAHERLTFPLSARGINGEVWASGRLRLTPDFDVFAWLCERWLETSPRDPDGWTRFTLRDLGLALHGQAPSGEHRRVLRESLERLYRIEVAIFGSDFFYEQGTLTRLFFEVRATGARRAAGDDRRKLGAMRGSTFEARLPEWLRDRLVRGALTYLDFETLRELEGIAKRVWVYLAAERFERLGDGVEGACIGLGEPALVSFGVEHYGRRRDARKALDRAGERICDVDRRYQSVRVERRPGSYALVAKRLDSEGRRARAAGGRRMPARAARRRRCRRTSRAPRWRPRPARRARAGG